MNAQSGSTNIKNIGQDLIKSAMKMADDNSQMNGITVSMEAMFFMETKEVDEISEINCAKYSAQLIETFMPDKKVAVHPEHHADIFATDMMTAPTYSSDLFLCSNDLDNENFGDIDDFNNYRHFFSLLSRPTAATEIPAIMMGTMDRLTSRPFGTSEATAMRIRVGHNHLRNISLLALALNTPDTNWMERLNRADGKRFSSESWAERTLKERLIANVLTSNIDLNAERTSVEWAAIFEMECDFDMAEDDFMVTSIDMGRTFVTFNHIAGDGYEVDFGTNLEVVNEMCKVVDGSIVKDNEAYWSKPQNAKLIDAFLDDLKETHKTSTQIGFVKVSANQRAYYVIKDGQKVGKVSIYNSGEENGMSNSVLTVGPLSAWIADQKTIAYEAALLLDRCS